VTQPAPVRLLGEREAEALRPRLAEILIDCVAHGASVGFLAPLEPAAAAAYWRGIQASVAAGRRLLLAGALEDGDVAGTVQVDLDTLPNQRHRATVAKLLVRTDARRRGLGEALLAAAERVALEHGRWLLTLDSATDDAIRLYERTGWHRAGMIPDYALTPEGRLAPTVLYWKKLRRA
jgi:ribosomal protein S18 acetylase RimI-like enzyme